LGFLQILKKWTAVERVKQSRAANTLAMTVPHAKNVKTLRFWAKYAKSKLCQQIIGIVRLTDTGQPDDDA